MSSPNEPEPVKIALETASSPSFLLIKMLQFEFEPTSSLLRAYWKIGSLSLVPGAYLLRAKILARASEPEPRLVPPLLSTRICFDATIPIFPNQVANHVSAAVPTTLMHEKRHSVA